MFYLGFVGLLGPLIVLALIVGSVHAIWRTVTLPRGTKRTAVCERCKYEVTDLASFTCPECGEDLRRVGIVTPAMESRRRGSLAGAILAWTFLCGLVAYIAMMGVFLWGVGGSTISAVNSWTQSLTPASGLYQSIDITYQTDGVSLASEFQVALTLSDGSTHELAIDPGPMSVLGLRAGQTDWTADTIGAWFAEAGLDSSDPAIAADAVEVTRFVDLLVMSPSSAWNANLTRHQSQFMGGSRYGASPDRFIDSTLPLLAITVGVAAFVYIVGLLLIIRRRRRLLRSVGAL